MATSSPSIGVPAADDLERFAYVASHDMAEPLRMISGYLDLIRESYGSQLDADFEDFIALAIDGADRMLAYLESLRGTRASAGSRASGSAWSCVTSLTRR